MIRAQYTPASHAGRANIRKWRPVDNDFVANDACGDAKG
jgi:hypothetical protein